jgi:hypothetical protein
VRELNRYAFYVELIPPVFTVEAESVDEARVKAKDMIKEYKDDFHFKIWTNLYADEFWELKEE